MTTTDTSVATGVDATRLFARVFGVVLLLVGILGLVLGDKLLFGILNIDLVEDLIHVASGLLLLYVGFAANAPVAKALVVGLGVVYLIVTLLGFFAPGFIEKLNPSGYTVVDNLIHLLVGTLAIVAALLVKPSGPRAPRAPKPPKKAWGMP